MTKITTASVKVMRSYDYCHFEINLATDVYDLNEEGQRIEIDDLRKTAMRLADKAVEQYKTAKIAVERTAILRDKWRLESAGKTPEKDRTPTEKAIIKYHSDAAFRAQFDYDYQDDYAPDFDDE